MIPKEGIQKGESSFAPMYCIVHTSKISHRPSTATYVRMYLHMYVCMYLSIHPSRKSSEGRRIKHPPLPRFPALSSPGCNERKRLENLIRRDVEMRYVTRARRQQLSMGGIFVRLDSSLNLIEDCAKYIYMYMIYIILGRLLGLHILFVGRLFSL